MFGWFLTDFLQENGVARWGAHFVNKFSSQHKLTQEKPIHKHSSNLAPCGKALAYQIPGVDKALINPKSTHQPHLRTSLEMMTTPPWKQIEKQIEYQK